MATYDKTRWTVGLARPAGVALALVLPALAAVSCLAGGGHESESLPMDEVPLIKKACTPHWKTQFTAPCGSTNCPLASVAMMRDALTCGECDHTAGEMREFARNLGIGGTCNGMNAWEVTALLAGLDDSSSGHHDGTTSYHPTNKCDTGYTADQLAADLGPSGGKVAILMGSSDAHGQSSPCGYAHGHSIFAAGYDPATEKFTLFDPDNLDGCCGAGTCETIQKWTKAKVAAWSGGFSGNGICAVVAKGEQVSTCGDGHVDQGEQCDLGANNGKAASCCTASCKFASAGTACTDQIPSDCFAAQCSGTSATCSQAYACQPGPNCDCGGNGVSCGDGQCNGDETCSSCLVDCGPCQAGCGDGVMDAGEACDGADLGAATCQSLGFAGGTLACAGNCTLDTSGCAAGPAWHLPVPGGTDIFPFAGQGCNGANAEQSDGLLVGLDYPSNGSLTTYDGKAVTSCVRVYFDRQYAISSLRVRAARAAEACSVPCGDGYCNSGAEPELFYFDRNVNEYRHVAANDGTTLTDALADSTWSVSFTSDVVLVCRSGAGYKRDDVVVDSVAVLGI